MENIEKKHRFIELRAKGMSFAKIAKKLKVSKQTLINWSDEFRYEIENLKAVELEALQEKYYIHKEQRIRMFGEQLKAVRKELKKRDLSGLSTEKLVDLLIRYDDLLYLGRKKDNEFMNEYSLLSRKESHLRHNPIYVEGSPYK